ncbi:MAG: YfhO family protein [bacterium]
MKIKNFLAIAILFVLTIIYFWKFVFLGLLPLGGDILTYTYPPWFYHYHAQNRSQNPLLSDPTFLHYPLRELATSSLHEGKITLWNPYIFCGNPLFSTNSVSFAPLNLLFLFFDPLIAYSLILICQMLLSGIFMYLFLRSSLSLGIFGALIGSICYEFSGFSIIWLEMGVLSGYLLPLILFLVDKTIIKRNIFYASLSGVVLGLQLLSSFLQMGLFVILITMSYSLFRLWGQRLKYLLLVILIFIFGFSLAAIQLIPSYELIKNAQRESIKDYRLLSPLPWQDLVTFLIPNYYGNPVDYNYNIIRENFHYIFKKYGFDLPPLHPKRGIMEDNYNEHCAYMGILPLILALLAIFIKRNKNTIFWASFTLLSLLLVLGTPLYYLFYLIVPGGNKLIICRLIFLYTFGISVLAGLGSNYILSNVKKVKVLSGGIILVFGLIIIMSFYLGKQVTNYLMDMTLQNHFTLLNTDFLYPALLLFASWITLLSINKARDLYVKAIILLIIIVDLFIFGLRYNPFVPKHVIYATTPSLKFLMDRCNEEKSRILAFEHLLPVSVNIAYGLETVEGYDGMFPKRYDEFMNLVDPFSSPWENAREIMFPSRTNRKLLCLLNTKYIFTSQKLKSDNLKLVFDSDKGKIYEDKNALPRAFIVYKYKVIKDKDKIFKELVSRKFNPQEYVILEERPKTADRGQRTEDRRQRTGDIEPEIIKYKNEEVVIRCRMKDDGFLVLSDTYYPGWQVYVDGSKEKIFCANYTLRAVYLTEGEHLVEFRYSPLSFKIGSFISIATLMIFMILGMRSVRKRR